MGGSYLTLKILKSCCILSILIKMALAKSALTRLASRKSLAAVTQYRSYAEKASGSMAFTFAAPNQVYYNQADVKQVDVPSFSGNFGILPEHVPTLAVIKPGVMSVIEKSGDAKKFFVSSGSITINDDSSVQILCEEAVPVSDLDANACRECLTASQAELSKASGETARAEALIAVEVSEALVQAAANA